MIPGYYDQIQIFDLDLKIKIAGSSLAWDILERLEHHLLGRAIPIAYSWRGNPPKPKAEFLHCTLRYCLDRETTGEVLDSLLRFQRGNQYTEIEIVEVKFELAEHRVMINCASELACDRALAHPRVQTPVPVSLPFLLLGK